MTKAGKHTVSWNRIRGCAGAGVLVLTVWDVGMDRLRVFLEAVRTHEIAQGNFRGLLHVLIGRRITLADGTPVSGGMTWRELAALLKKYRWDREAVRDLELEPADLPPRDRQRFWYTAISQAGLNTPAAISAGDALVEALRELGYEVAGAPGTAP
jgi:hypothetical protein